jgi:hypothetical protein
MVLKANLMHHRYANEQSEICFHSPLLTIKMGKKCTLVSSKIVHLEAQNSKSNQVAIISSQSIVQKTTTLLQKIKSKKQNEKWNLIVF